MAIRRDGEAVAVVTISGDGGELAPDDALVTEDTASLGQFKGRKRDGCTRQVFIRGVALDIGNVDLPRRRKIRVQDDITQAALAFRLDARSACHLTGLCTICLQQPDRSSLQRHQRAPIRQESHGPGTVERLQFLCLQGRTAAPGDLKTGVGSGLYRIRCRAGTGRQHKDRRTCSQGSQFQMEHSFLRWRINAGQRPQAPQDVSSDCPPDRAPDWQGMSRPHRRPCPACQSCHAA